MVSDGGEERVQPTHHEAEQQKGSWAYIGKGEISWRVWEKGEGRVAGPKREESEISGIDPRRKGPNPVDI